MATFKAILAEFGVNYPTQSLAGKLATVNISGTVKVDGIGVIREILVYKFPSDDLFTSVYSASDGSFSIDAYGGRNDVFRVICVGKDGENSQVFDHLQQAV